jgi:CspA family cold shock protein
MDERVGGTIRWFSEALAYGFITTEDGRDVFVHRSAIAGEWPVPGQGQMVTLRVREGPRGLLAENVELIGSAITPGPQRPRGERPGPPAYAESSDRRVRGNESRAPSGSPRDLNRHSIPAQPVLARVERVMPDGRFLFARADTVAVDIFVHGELFSRRGIAVQAGDRVWLRVEHAERGPRAVSPELA